MQFRASKSWFHLYRALGGAVVAWGLLSLPAAAQTAPQGVIPQPPIPANQPAPLSAEQLQTWRAALDQSPVPAHMGCFSAKYPSAAWADVPCVTPPNRPYWPSNAGGTPAHGGGTTTGPSAVGNGNDYVATTGPLISSATGSFPKVSGVLNEADSGTANRYSLQLNTNFFTGTPACNTAANPSNCEGWEQFVYSNSGTAFIQYWLIDYATTCPSDWNTAGKDCWKNAPQGAAYGPEPITNLSGEEVTGSTNGTTDTIKVSGPGGTASASNTTTVLGLANYWFNAEFNIVGDCCSSRANFNSGVTIKVNTQVNTGGTAAPGCAVNGTTGETNDTNLVAPCTTTKGSKPSITFSESNPPGSIWVYTGTPCNDTSCPGWQELDNNNESVRIDATGTNLYQLWNNGNVYKYDGTPCSSTCPGWKRLFDDPNTWEIVAGGNHLYQYEDDGKLWEYVSGTEWRLLDDNTSITTMVTASGGLYELHSNGAIWAFTGSPCTSTAGTDCPGWQQIDNNANTVQLATGLSNLYEMHKDGTIWKYTNTPCSGSTCPGWKQIGNNPNALEMVAGGNNLYELDTTGAISKYTGTACTKTGCTGWQMLDNNPAAMQIAADTNSNLYELHTDGRLWKYTGTPCIGNSCGGWQMIDNNTWIGRIVASSGLLYELHGIQTPMPAHANVCYGCR